MKNRSAYEKWIIAEEPDPRITSEIALANGIHVRAASILAQRGFDARSAQLYLRPSLEQLHDPFRMRDMDKAAARVLSAIRNRETVVIHGDYDVDGIAGAALLFSFLKRRGCPVEYYIPSRIEEGYGLSEQGVRWSIDRGAGLLITVDTGTTDSEEIGLATQSGVDVIIADHHEPGPCPPNAYAFLNPKYINSGYPFSDLSGCGVAFKLRQSVSQKLGEDPAEAYGDVDLVALATVCDVVPMVDENRIFAKFGIDLLEKTDRPGVVALKRASGLDKKGLSAYHLGFVLGPRLNAAGRIASAMESVKLLTTESLEEAYAIADRLNDQNQKRRDLNERIFSEASAIVESELDLDSTFGIVLASADWHEGVIGIVASKIAERYHRPTVIISLDGKRGKGSARSVDRVNLYEALLECAARLQDFGGHEKAAGLVIRPEDIPAFTESFNAAVGRQVALDELVPATRIDSALRVSEIDEHLFRSLEMMRPFGISNPRPVFLSRSAEIVGAPAVVGKSHLKFRVRDGTVVRDAIGFGMAERIDTILPRPRVDLVYTLQQDEYMGRKKLSLSVRDFKTEA